MKIGVDLDEVLSDTLTQLIQFHNETYGTSFERKGWYSYRFEEVWGGTKEEAYEKIRKFNTTDYFKNIKPQKKAQEILKKLKEDGQELFVITGRSEFLSQETADWLNKYFPAIFSGIKHTDSADKTRSTPKSTLCQSVGAEIMIEDNLDFAKDCAECGIKVILIDYPWNQSESLPANIFRVNSWKDVYKKITSGLL